MQNADEMLSLLLVIKHNKNNSSFIIDHLGYARIGKLCIDALSAGYIHTCGNSYHITDKGLQFIAAQNNLMNRKGLYREIAKIPDALCPKIQIDSIYLPEDF